LPLPQRFWFQKLGLDKRSAIRCRNQLLTDAGIHVKPGSTGAAEYLEQALDCQRSVENSIKGDLMGILYQLGITYTLSGDIAAPSSASTSSTRPTRRRRDRPVWSWPRRSAASARCTT